MRAPRKGARKLVPVQDMMLVAMEGLLWWSTSPRKITKFADIPK